MIKNTINNKVYIGRSVNIKRRWLEHKWQLSRNIHKNKHLQAAWNKYGKTIFIFNVLEECSENNLNEREIYYINLYNSTDDSFGYNWTGGGDGLVRSNETIRKKRSESQKRFINENPEKAKLRLEHAISTTRTEEHREKQRQKTVELFKNPEFYKKYRELRSSKEYRDKISQSHKGKRPSQKSIDLLKERIRKPVLCVETGVVYESIKAANAALPGNKNVSDALNGKYKQVGGFHWKYAEKNAV